MAQQILGNKRKKKKLALAWEKLQPCCDGDSVQVAEAVTIGSGESALRLALFDEVKHGDERGHIALLVETAGRHYDALLHFVDADCTDNDRERLTSRHITELQPTGARASEQLQTHLKKLASAFIRLRREKHIASLGQKPAEDADAGATKGPRTRSSGQQQLTESKVRTIVQRAMEQLLQKQQPRRRSSKRAKTSGRSSGRADEGAGEESASGQGTSSGTAMGPQVKTEQQQQQQTMHCSHPQSETLVAAHSTGQPQPTAPQALPQAQAQALAQLQAQIAQLQSQAQASLSQLQPLTQMQSLAAMSSPFGLQSLLLPPALSLPQLAMQQLPSIATAASSPTSLGSSPVALNWPASPYAWPMAAAAALPALPAQFPQSAQAAQLPATQTTSSPLVPATITLPGGVTITFKKD